MKRTFALVVLQVAAAALAQPVLAPHHGDVLFQHFQGRWAAALGSLMTSQHFERLAPHDAEAELLRGGLLLDWGQHDEAAEVFERVAERHPLQRDRAWTMLAKARWQRGRIDDAKAALARVRAPLQGAEREAERLLLQALVHLARDRAAAAVEVLQPLAATLPAARFNHAVALLRAGRPDEARRALEALGRERAVGDERQLLRDRANLALAQQALQATPPDPAAARAALQRVRLHAAPSGRALLADGWAALQLGRPQDAVVSWSELAQRSSADPSVFEARLALPRAWAEAGARGQALQRAEALLQQIDDEARTLQAARAAVQDGRALQPLLDALRAHEPGRDTDGTPPEGEHADALRPLWADHAFQTALARWADLQWSTRELQRWAGALVAFDDMRALRLAGFEQRLPPTLSAAADDARGLQAQARARDALALQLDEAEARDDGHTLALEAEQAQLQRLQRVRADLATLGNDPEAPALRERARRVAGLLEWQLAAARPERLWSARKAVRELDALLARAAARLQALEHERQAEPQRLAALGQRITQAAERLAALQPRVAALADEQRLALQAQGLALLDERARRLAGHALQARLLHAQLQDGTWAAQARPAEPGAHDAPR